MTGLSLALHHHGHKIHGWNAHLHHVLATKGGQTAFMVAGFALILLILISLASGRRRKRAAKSARPSYRPRPYSRQGGR